MGVALICGISGQDGGFLAKFLLSKGYRVFGTSRDAQMSNFNNLSRLGIKEEIEVMTMIPTDFRSVLQTLDQVRPDEIYNFSGQSSVGLSFELPVETLDSISIGTLNLLEVIRFLDFPVKFYNAGSGECFGETPTEGADENTLFRPRSPYAVAKSAAYWQVTNYREAYGIFCCSGILFNHESYLRPERFVTQKIIAAASRIALGSKEKLRLGNLDIRRDWGWAPEYVEAMWLMLQQKTADDYVIATGCSFELKDFVVTAFQLLDVDWEESVEIDKNLFRPSDITYSQGNPTKAKQMLDWEAKTKGVDVVRNMIDYSE